MNASRDVRASGVLGHLLLVGALTFAVLVMHTVCHADGSPVHGMSATPHGAGHPHDEPASDGSAQLSAQYSHSSTVTSPSNGMDMASPCVGVIRSSAAADTSPRLVAPGQGSVAERLRPTPLLREPNLARLPVLRI